jgi:hypothetical protein
VGVLKGAGLRQKKNRVVDFNIHIVYWRAIAPI